MTQMQASQIRELRIQGHGYRAIGSMVGLSRDIVRNFCKSKGLDGYATALAINIKEKLQQSNSCSYCGKQMEQSSTGRPKKFCSDKCRREWWKAHPEAIAKKETAIYLLTCSYCGSSFESYGNKKRKYCSHNCYIRDRFWREEDGIQEI